MTGLRSRRLRKTLDPAAARLLESTDEDQELAAHDILGSLAHIQVLLDAGVLTTQEAADLSASLAAAHRDASQGGLALDPGLEDVHMNVEAMLIEQHGDLGKKIHTARSRNDQVALDLRMGARQTVLDIAACLAELVDALHALGDKAPDAVLAGTTHLQPAQPVSFPHWAGMHAERFLRDLQRLRDAWARINISPLGAGALAGTPHPIDPSIAAQALAFDATFTNSLDAVSDRDFLIELAGILELAAVHASQLAEDVILWTTPALGYLRLDDAFATGSSIMPQKRNPDVFEVARAHAASATGTRTALAVTAKGLAAGYNRDLQEQKRVALGAWADARRLWAALPAAVAALEPDPDAMLSHADRGFIDATDIADVLVQNGVPFRQAHARAADLVAAAEAQGTTLEGLDDGALSEAAGMDPAVLRRHLGPVAALAGKSSPGGAATERQPRQRQAQVHALREAKRFFSLKQQQVQEAAARLTGKAQVPQEAAP